MSLKTLPPTALSLWLLWLLSGIDSVVLFVFWNIISTSGIVLIIVLLPKLAVSFFHPCVHFSFAQFMVNPIMTV